MTDFRKKITKEVQTDELMSNLDILESDLNKLRIENLKQQKVITQLQENLSLYSNNNNNTSSKFMLPSEFKSKYETMVKESLAGAFASLFENPKLLVQGIQSSCLFLDQYIRQHLQSKTNQIAQIMGINSIGLQQGLLRIYQDNYQNVLSYDDTVITQLKAHLKLNSQLQPFSEEENEDLEEWVKQYWSLLSYIVLSDQEINIGFSKVNYDTVEFKKNEYYCIDGFGKEGAKCLIILPSIMRKNQSFNGIKCSVLILPSGFDVNTLEDDLKLEDLAQELKSYNSPKQIQPPVSANQESRPFFSQRNEEEEYRIKQPKVKKSLLYGIRDQLRQLGHMNQSEHSTREVGKIFKQSNNPLKEDLRKSIQQTLKQNRNTSLSTWQKMTQQKHPNKENVQNTSLNLQQLIRKIQVDKPLKKNESKIIKSFCQSQQPTGRTRAQSRFDDISISPLRGYKI